AWKLACDKGWIDLAVTLAPTMPPRIQYLAEEGSSPPDERLTAAAARAAALIERWDDAVSSDLFAKDIDRARMQRLFADTAAARGACKLGPAERGDGAHRARFLLSCDRADVVLELSLDEASGKVKAVKFLPRSGRVAKCAQ